MINDFASNENRGILKTEKQLLIEAEQKIGQLENDKRRMAGEVAAAKADKEKLTWQNAQLRVGITALALHYKATNEQVEKIYNDYQKAQEEEFAKLGEEEKKKFFTDLHEGRVPDLRVKPEEQGNVEQFPTD